MDHLNLNSLSRPALLFALVVSGSLYLLFSLVLFARRTARPPSFPPGPPTLPLLGNLHQIPLKKPFLKFEEWRARYGDVIGLKMGPNNLVVLSDPAHVRELFQRRSARYSGRPYTYIPQEHVMKPGDQHVLFMQDDRRLRRWRAAAARNMTGPAAVARAAPIQAALASKLVWQLARDPAGWNRYSGEWSLGIPILCVAGQTLDDYPEGFGEYYLDVQKQWLELLEPGNTPPVDIFPFLARMPAFMAPWKHRAAHVREVLYDVYGRLIAAAKEKAAGDQFPYTPVLVRLVRERDLPSFSSSEKEKERENDSDLPPMTDSDLLSIGSGLLDASVDSMHAVVETLILTLICHPDKLQKARAEVDAVTTVAGGGLPPTEAHVHHMPYIKACLLEVLRFRTPAPLLIPRMLTRDDIVDGYVLPAGTTVLANVHAIHHRAEDYHDPESFVPERYLANPTGVKPELWDEEAASSSPVHRPTYAFGAGRRKCPGEEFALANMAVVVSKLLWAFDLSYPPGDRPDLGWERGFSNGLSMAPERFRAVWTLREGRTIEEIEAEYRRSMQALVALVGTGSRKHD